MPIFLALLAVQVAPAPPRDCAHDRAAMLALDEQAFDQDMTGGWRTLADAGCEREAADLIRDWRDAHPGLTRRYLSFWHEGQLRAIAGQTARAIALFGQSYRPPGEDRIGWNHYVDGSIAFLRRDRSALAAARARLAATPEAANVTVLDGLRRCWTRSYAEAYPCKLPRRPAGVSPAR